MKPRKNHGFTIIELMIAIAIGMLIIAGVAQIYMSNRNNYVVQEGLARLQENGRFANFILNKDLRMVGYMGCGNQSQVIFTNLIKSPTYSLDFGNPIKGYDSTASTFSPALPTNLSSAYPGSDVIEIRMASPLSTLLNNDMDSSPF